MMLIHCLPSEAVWLHTLKWTCCTRCVVVCSADTAEPGGTAVQSLITVDRVARVEGSELRSGPAADRLALLQRPLPSADDVVGRCLGHPRGAVVGCRRTHAVGRRQGHTRRLLRPATWNALRVQSARRQGRRRQRLLANHRQQDLRNRCANNVRFTSLAAVQIYLSHLSSTSPSRCSTLSHSL